MRLRVRIATVARLRPMAQLSATTAFLAWMITCMGAEMSEIFDHGLREEHEATDHDRLEREQGEQLERDRQQLQDFADWIETYSGRSCKATVRDNECYMVVPSSTLWIMEGRLVASVAPFPWEALWAIYKEQKKETSKP